MSLKFDAPVSLTQHWEIKKHPEGEIIPYKPGKLNDDTHTTARAIIQLDVEENPDTFEITSFYAVNQLKQGSYSGSLYPLYRSFSGSDRDHRWEVEVALPQSLDGQFTGFLVVDPNNWPYRTKFEIPLICRNSPELVEP